MFDSQLLQGKKILVTGGGTGLGAAMALRFAELGASLAICGRREAMLLASAAHIRQATGASVQTVVCDIREASQVSALFDELWSVAPVDVLVNNAAATFIAQTEQLSARAADAILAPTLHGGLYCTLEAGRRWLAGSSKTDENSATPLAPKVVLSILSTSTLTGRAFTVPSAMAKSAMLAMTRSLAVEWGPRGVRCVAIAPGPFPTQGSDAQLRPSGRGADAARGSIELNPLRRVGSPIELCNLAAFLVSDQASYINGEMVAIDGGAHLRTSGAEDLLHWGQAQWQALSEQRRKR